MSGQDAILYAIIGWAVALPLLTWIVGRHLRKRRREMPTPDDLDPALLDLGEPLNRIKLQTMIDNYGLHGSVNIRDGRVYPYANKTGREQLSRKLMNPTTMIPNLNTELCIPVDGKWVPTDLTLHELRLAALALED